MAVYTYLGPKLHIRNCIVFCTYSVDCSIKMYNLFYLLPDFCTFEVEALQLLNHNTHTLDQWKALDAA